MHHLLKGSTLSGMLCTHSLHLTCIYKTYLFQFISQVSYVSSERLLDLLVPLLLLSGSQFFLFQSGSQLLNFEHGQVSGRITFTKDRSFNLIFRSCSFNNLIKQLFFFLLSLSKASVQLFRVSVPHFDRRKGPLVFWHLFLAFHF